MYKKGYESSSPINKLISHYLTLWVASKCKAAEDIKVQLNGSAFALSRGQLSGANLSAKNVDFKDLKIKYIHLKSNAFKINFLSTIRNRKLHIKEGFKIEGLLTLDNKSLEESLLNGKWSWLGCWLSQNLTGQNKPSKIEIIGSKIRLFTDNRTYSESDLFSISASNGTIKFTNNENTKSEFLPMDRLIKIKEIYNQDECLSITLEAKVNL